MKIGFIGLGSMGLPMAGHLVDARHEITVYNRTRARTDDLAKRGVWIATSPREAAQGADVLITMLSDDSAVEQVIFGEDGALASLRPGAVHVSMSTIGHVLSRRLTDQHGAKGQG